ncbi:hypothetical protein ACWEQL_36365 [Kitasatospora sp. NPDC004240]
MKSFVRIGAAAAAALLLAACSGGGGSAFPDRERTEAAPPPSSGSATPTRTATPTPTAPPYGPVLTRWIDPVNTALAKLSASAGLDAFSTALQEVATAANSASTGLTAAREPATVSTARRQLVTALGQLATDLDQVRGDIRRKNLCATSAALATVGRSEGLKGVPAALQQMTAAGYPTTFTVPQTGELQTRGLANGYVIRKGSLNGEGTLTVSNGGSADAVVSLAKGGKAVHSMYIGKGQKAHVDGIEDGVYEVYFSGGVDWDPTLKAFTRNCDFSKFEDTMEYTTGRTRTTWTITLQPTAGGNAKTTDVPEAQFPQP